MRFEFKPSFERSVKSLSPEIKLGIKDLCKNLIDILDGHCPLGKGLGLKNLRDDFWEIRKGLKLRILFKWQNDLVQFILAGTHDHIKNFLKKI
jgi:mRNA-degrading endonuclease RelE of RelBE toxin-antitoxin system